MQIIIDIFGSIRQFQKFMLWFVLAGATIIAGWKAGAPLSLDIFIAFAFASFWAVRNENAARQNAILHNMLRFAISQIRAADTSLETPVYSMLTQNFQHDDLGQSGDQHEGFRSVKLLSGEKNTHPIEEVARNWLSEDRVATDYLCVVYANLKTKFLEPSQFKNQVAYFSNFHRCRNQRDRITRVFSIPATFHDGWPTWPPDAQPPIDAQLATINLEMRQRLFALMWLNRVLGVDTKLHVFDPKKLSRKQFFETADYVLCHNPCAIEQTHRSIVYLAQPGMETECLKIAGNSAIYDLFYYEFYRRLSTRPNLTNPIERILEFSRYNSQRLTTCLGLTRPQECSNALSSLEKTLNELLTSKGLPDWFDKNVVNSITDKIKRWP